MTSVVYFVECSATGRIKIGISDDLTRRLAQLNMNNCAPVRLVGAMSGGLAVEQHLHKQFADQRLHGEWFSACPEIWALIEQVNHGVFSLEVVEIPKRIANEDFAPALKQASEDLRFIGSSSGHTKTKLRIAHAAATAGLSYWRAFDLWYSKARQILPIEQTAISEAAERVRRLAAGV